MGRRPIEPETWLFAGPRPSLWGGLLLEGLLDLFVGDLADQVNESGAKTLYQCPDPIDTEDGEVTDEQLQEIVQRHTETMEKVKSLCGFIRYLEHGIAACKQERDRIAQRQKTAEHRLERIKAFEAWLQRAYPERYQWVQDHKSCRNLDKVDYRQAYDDLLEAAIMNF